MTCLHRIRFRSRGAALSLAAISTGGAAAGLPVTGVPVPQLAAFDDAMQDFMADWGLNAGVLAVSRNGQIIYQRGFGNLGLAGPLPENTPMRLASCEKPITSAAIRVLVGDGTLMWSDFIFDLGQPGTAILPHQPWQGLGDNRLDNVTVQHAFNHQGGWNRSAPGVPDPQFHSVTIANEMGVAHPAGRDNTIRWMLSQPLQFTPGTNGCMDSNGNPTICYSNFGYMLLGRVIEEVTGQNYIDYVRQNVLTPDLWVPSTEIFTGRTFAASQSLREPHYATPNSCTNVFNPSGAAVNCAYGGWNHESFIGHGNLVASAAALLTYMDNYWVGVGGMAGTPLDQNNTGGGVHNGMVQGANSTMWQRGDGINIAVLFNTDEFAVGAPEHLAWTLAGDINAIIDNGGFSWPTFAVDGFWVDFGSGSTLQVGGYNAPFHSMSTALANTTDGTKLRFQPGSSAWTGTISEKMRLDAPFGMVRIGQ